MKPLLAAIVLAAFTVSGAEPTNGVVVENRAGEPVADRNQILWIGTSAAPIRISNGTAGLQFITNRGQAFNIVPRDRLDYSYEIAMHLDEANRHLEKVEDLGRAALSFVTVFGIAIIALKVFELFWRITEPKNHK